MQHEPNAQRRRLPREGESLSKFAWKPDYRVNAETGCWEWLKGTVKGYGTATIDGLGQFAHRAYYAAAYGPIPPDHEVHHICRNPICVNPAHLECIDGRAHDIAHNLHDDGLSIETVAEIRRLGTLPDASVEAVAEQFGIPQTRVKRYWAGRGWNEFFQGTVRPLGRECVGCGAAIEPERPRGTKWCSEKCKCHHYEKTRGPRSRPSRAKRNAS